MKMLANLPFIIFSFYYLTSIASAAEIDCKETLPNVTISFLDCCPVYTDANHLELSKMMQKCDSDTVCEGMTCAITSFNILDSKGELDELLMDKFGARLGNPDDVNAFLKEVAVECWKNDFSKSDCKQEKLGECFVNGVVQKCSKSQIWNQNKIGDCDLMKRYLDICPIPFREG